MLESLDANVGRHAGLIVEGDGRHAGVTRPIEDEPRGSQTVGENHSCQEVYADGQADALAKWCAKLQGPRDHGTFAKGKGCAAAGGNKDTAEIRKWAKENGYSVNDRGRVPAEIREAYEKANG